MMCFYQWIEQLAGRTVGNIPVVLTVASDGSGDYTTIGAALAASAGATAIKPYVIYIKNGTYNEIQLTGHNYVTVEGESRDGVVMVSDGLRTDVDPVSGLPYDEMAESAKHGWAVNHTMTFKNMTIRVNDVKYCIHSDAMSGAYTITMRGVALSYAGHNSPFGMGLYLNQRVICTDCIFEYRGETPNTYYGVFMHNWNEMAAGCALTLRQCDFINCGVASLFELGSEQVDLVTLDGCITDDVKGIKYNGTATYWDGGAHDVTDVPYCLNVLIQNGDLPISFDADNRPNAMDYIVTEGA